MTQEDPPPLTAATTSTVAVVAFALALLGLAGNLANNRLTRQGVRVLETVQNRGAEVDSTQARSIAALREADEAIPALEARVKALEDAAAAATPAATPE